MNPHSTYQFNTVSIFFGVLFLALGIVTATKNDGWAMFAGIFMICVGSVAYASGFPWRSADEEVNEILGFKPPEAPK